MPPCPIPCPSSSLLLLPRPSSVVSALLYLSQAPHFQLANILVVCATATCLAAVLGLALAEDGSDTVTLGALDTVDHELAVMQGGAAGTWDWGIVDAGMDTAEASGGDAANSALVSGARVGACPSDPVAGAAGASPRRYV